MICVKCALPKQSLISGNLRGSIILSLAFCHQLSQLFYPKLGSITMFECPVFMPTVTSAMSLWDMLLCSVTLALLNSHRYSVYSCDAQITSYSCLQEIGLASLGISDEWINKLASVSMKTSSLRRIHLVIYI